MKRTVFPPNCEVRNSNPSRLLNFVAKQRRVFAEYGFWLSAKRRTESEKDGYRRYMRDYRRSYRAEHIDKLKAYRHDYWQNVTKRGFECKAEAVGDEVKLKRRAERKAAEQKRAAQEARRQEVHAKYGFWLGRTPQTPEEVAGRERYRRERDAAYKLAHQEQQKAYRLERNKRIKAQRETKFQEKYRALLAVDPVQAETFRKKHVKLLVIQNMTHEERVRYRQQKQFEKLKAQAARKAEREASRKEREVRRIEVERIRRAKAEERQKQTKKELERKRREERRQEREAEAAALAEAERRATAAFASEREANRAAYLAAKAADNREEGKGKSDEASALDAASTTTTVSFGGLPPNEPPAIITGGEPPDDGDDEEEARRMREEAARAARVAKEAEREAERKARQEARQAAREAKLAAERKERADFKAKAKELHLPLQKARWTPAHQKIWDKAMRREARERLEAKRDERRRRRQAEAAAIAERLKAKEEKRRAVLEKYGFTLGKKPVTPEEIEGRRRYDRDMEAKERERRHDKINEYNREYRRRKRQEALERAQEKWSAAQWAEWEKRQEAKGRGTPAWLVREVAKYLAEESSLSPDQVMAWLIEHDGVDFLAKGAESMGRKRLLTKAAIPMAARAVMFYCNPDTAIMFKPSTESLALTEKQGVC